MARRAVGCLALAVLAVQSAGPVRPLAAVPSAAPVRAQSLDSPAEEARLLRQVEESLERKKGLDNRVAELDKQLTATRDELRNAQNSLYAASVKQRNTEARLEEVKEELAGAERALKEFAIAAYTGHSDAGRLLSLLLKASDISDVATKQSYLRLASSTQADLVVARQNLRDEINDLSADLEAAVEQADTDRRRIARDQASLQEDRDEQAAARREIGLEIINREVLLREIVRRQDEFEGQARELEAQSKAVAEQLSLRSSSSSSSSASASSAPDDIAAPLSSLRVSSSFGYRVHPIYGTVRLHAGIDLAANTGTPIKAANGGVVVSAGWLGGYGNATIIDHGDGVATLYGHQSAILVRAGQEVDKGDVIGRVGCTGSCTGPHLHFEVRLDGNPVDPKTYLSK